MKPIEEEPASVRMEFTSEAMAATEGDEHEVPQTISMSAPITTS